MIPLPYIAAIKAGGLLLLLGAIAWGGHKIHGSIWQAGFNAANVRAEQVIAEFARAEADAQAKARAAEQAKAQAMAGIDIAYQQGQDDAQRNYDQRISDLQSGTIKLRQHWLASTATCNLSATADATRERDAAVQLLRESVGRIGRAVEECDAQGNAAIAVIQAMGSQQ